MDIRHARLFITWKTGVELKLYEFQITQSKNVHKNHLATPVGHGHVHPNSGMLQEHTDLGVIKLSTSVVALQDSDEKTIRKIGIDNQVHTNDIADQTDWGAVIFQPPKNSGTTPTIAMQDFMPVTMTEPKQTPAAAFVAARPGGPLQLEKDAMQICERRVTAHLQRKSTTAPEGRMAMADIASMTAAANTKVNKRKPLSKKTKGGKIRKGNTTVELPIILTKDNVTPIATVVVVADAVPFTCTYGCQHVGLVGLKQMMPHSTSY